MRSGNKDKTKKEFDELLLEVRRVTRVTTGGRKMSFRATVLAGNKKGKIGIGLAKGPDVTTAVHKASREAYKTMFQVPLTRNLTVPYPIGMKYKACFVKLLPASAGTGLKAGSSVRAVLELAGYENVLSKIVGSSNKLNNAMATIKALCAYKHADYFNSLLVKKAKRLDTEESEESSEKSEEVATEEKKQVETITETSRKIEFAKSEKSEKKSEKSDKPFKKPIVKK